MGIFTGLFHSAISPRTAWGTRFPSCLAATSGKTVNEHTALQTTAVYACVRILAETVAGLPLHVYQYRMDVGNRSGSHSTRFTICCITNPIPR